MITRARAAGLLVGGAVLSWIRVPVRAQTMPTIRVAVNPIEPASEPYYAKDMGFFANAGIDADIQPMPNAGAVAAALVSGAIDIGYLTIDTLALTHQKNIPLTILAPANEYNSPATLQSMALIVPANSVVREAKDLNGKTVAIGSLSGFTRTAPSVWFEANGADLSTIKFVEVPFPAMPAALDASRVDAAWVPEPFLGVARKSGRVLGYGADGISKHFLLAAWSTTPQWAKDHPDLVKRFAAAIRTTAAWANSNPSKSGEILAKYTKIDPGLIATMQRVRYCEQLTAALIQPLINASAKYNGFTAFPAQELLRAP